MATIPPEYSHFSFAPSSTDRPSLATRRPSSRASSLPPPSVPRPPRRRTQEFSGPTIHCPSQSSSCSRGVKQASPSPLPGTPLGGAVAALHNPATDHPLSTQEALDILARVERDVGRSDLNLQKIKGSIRAYAGLPATDEDLRATTVSPQEAFLDYTEVDHQLHDAGLDSKSSLFAPLPGHAHVAQHGSSHLHPRATPHTFEGNHTGGSGGGRHGFTPPESKARSFMVPENAVSWTSKSGSRSGPSDPDEASTTSRDESATTPELELEDDRKPEPVRPLYRKDDSILFPTPEYWPGPPSDNTIKPIPWEEHCAGRADLSPAAVERDAIDFAHPDQPLPSPSLDAMYGDAQAPGSTSAKLARYLGLPAPLKRQYSLDGDDYVGTSAGQGSSYSGATAKKAKRASYSPLDSSLYRSDDVDQLARSEDEFGSGLGRLQGHLLPGLVPNAPPKARKRRPSAPPLPPIPGAIPGLTPGTMIIDGVELPIPQPLPQPGQLRCPLNMSDGSACGVMFRRPYDLARHRETVHGEGIGAGKVAKSWRCEECKGVFSRKDALIRHARIVGHKTGL